MLISSDNLTRSHVAGVPLKSLSAIPLSGFAELLEPSKAKVEPYQNSALSFDALGMFGKFKSVNFIKSSEIAGFLQTLDNITPDQHQDIHGKNEFKQNSSRIGIQRQALVENHASLHFMTYHQKKSTNLTPQNHYVSKTIVENTYNASEKFETGLRQSKSANTHKAYERNLDQFRICVSQSGDHTIVSLTGIIFDLTESLKLRHISSKLFAEIGIKNGILYVNAKKVTEAYYFMREENHGSGAR